jgi:hypothetical protein
VEGFANPRKNQQNELHHANLARKGGLLLDLEVVQKDESEGKDKSAVSRLCHGISKIVGYG